MTNINPIQFGITTNYLKSKEEKQDLSQKTEKNNVYPEQKKHVNSNEVLSYMAAQNADLVPANAKRTVDVSKHVSEESAQRIEAFVNTFNADFEEAYNVAIGEFPDLTEAAAASLALSYINASY